jgi:uncharacterized membrane protein YkvA (DUF1232 family)
MDLKGSKEKLKIDVPAVFLALRRKEVPVLAKIIAVATVAYALSPIDLIPDFIPFFGILDDLIMLPLLVAAVVAMVPEAVFEECRKEADGLWAGGKPKKWYYAVPIILIWAFLVFIIAINFF